VSLLEHLGTESPEAAIDAVVGWAEARGMTLYPTQEEALLELAAGANVILATPTGSGKSLVAAGAHLMALTAGARTFYTAPIKALVSEKFFDLCTAFGTDRVGMMTGDASVNAGAPIICCTAEVLANVALRHGPDAEVGQVVADEFHYYSDPDRGWAWQVPLLELPQAQFLLMSATLGDVARFEDDLTRRTGRPTTTVRSATRPVPLDFSYRITPVHETLEDLLAAGRAPIYVVHPTQSGAVEQAQALTSRALADRAQRDAIGEAIGGFRFRAGFGHTLARLLRHGVGVHHAGMLPRYRRLVERLAQQGLLPVICGTDTLGVGINVPIRTVVLTSLTKFDGNRVRQLSARELHQIAGRAGRAGFDTSGWVVAQAPEHVIENERALAKAGDDARKRRKVTRKRPPDGFVSWSEATFERLVAAEPETLTSSFEVTHSMLLQVAARPSDPVATMRALLTGNHESPSAQRRHIRRALAIYRSLRDGGVLERLPEPDEHGRTVRLTVDLPEDFALNQPLSPFALAALELLDPSAQRPISGHGWPLARSDDVRRDRRREAPASAPDMSGGQDARSESAAQTYALDVVSIIEATLEDPGPVLVAQRKRARAEAVARMKAEGLDYDERMAQLEEVTHPRPLAQLLEAAWDTYRRGHPWVTDHPVRPKSVVREMHEQAMGFADYVAHLGLARSEGLLLRYLSDAYKALDRSVPESAKTEELVDLVAWLGELVRQVDSSLLDEWEALRDPEGALARRAAAAIGADLVEEPPPVTANARAFRVLVRNALFRRVELAAQGRVAELGELDHEAGWDAQRWADALARYRAAHGTIGTGPDARSPAMLLIDEGAAPRRWAVTQIIDDPEGDHDWRITAVVDLDASDDVGDAVVHVTGVGEA
jgi:superfamily II RNA helicase